MATFQHQFGQATIDSIISFCRADIKDVNDLYNEEFSHITDAGLRSAMAKTMFGGRWLYKLGLGLLVDGDEAIAHVRTQVIDYGSVCEALLGDCILHGLNRNILVGNAYRTVYCQPSGKSINWDVGDRGQKLSRRTFYWLIEVSFEGNIITTPIKRSLT